MSPCWVSVCQLICASTTPSREGEDELTVEAVAKVWWRVWILFLPHRIIVPWYESRSFVHRGQPPAITISFNPFPILIIRTANDSLGSSSLIITIHNAHMTCTHTHFYLNWLWSTPKLGLFYFPEFTLASSGNDERQERRCEWTVIGKCQPFANFKWGFSAPLWFCFGEKILLSGGMVIIRIRRVEDELPEFFLSIDLLLFSHILLRHQRNEFASRPVENNH